MGEYTVDLGDKIIEARIDYNEALTIQGPTHPSTTEAKLELKELDLTARYLFSPLHA